MGWDVAFSFILAGRALGCLQLSCPAGNVAMPLPVGAGFTGRKQGVLEDSVRGTHSLMGCAKRW